MICLFAGGGGLHLGFRQAGFSTAFASDNAPSAAATFRQNLPDVRFHLADIRQMTPSLLADLSGRHQIDVVVGGPPCQGFSTLGDQIGGDPRNTLFEAFARVIRWTRPKCLLMENTSYLRAQYNGQYEDEIRKGLCSLGYRIWVTTLNAADYGAPQIRHRVFFFGSRVERPFAWPLPTHGPAGSALCPYATVGDAIMDLAHIDTPEAVPNHVALRHSPRVVERYRLIPEGGRLPPPQHLPEDIRRRNFGNTYKRLHRRRPSLTLVPGNNAFPVHPVLDRSLTPREGARLQGFPDDYVFAGTRAEQCKLVGNAVPVQLARALAAAIANHLYQATSRKGTPAPDQTRDLATIVCHESAAGIVQLPLPFAAHDEPQHPRRTTDRRLTAVSLFTGAGGLLTGFARAGFRILASYDIKNHVAQNLAINFPTIRHFRADVLSLEPQEILADINGERPDVVFGGPPCQGFSVFGKRRFVRTRGHSTSQDPRNQLILRFVDLAIALQPRVVLLENVKGLLSTRTTNGLYIDEILGRFHRAGYQVETKVVNCADYGVPQLRQRLILIATKPGVELLWPTAKFFAGPRPWQRPYVTVGDVIADLADPATYGPEFSHVPMQHKELLVERYKLIPEGGKLPEDALPARLRKGYRSDHIRNYSHVYRRLSRFQPATTLVPGHNAFPIHPTLPRALTVREAARIQTFPDSMKFVGTRQQQCTLVGNAVPPLLAEVFAQAVAKAVRGNALSPGFKADHYELRADRRCILMTF